MSGSISSLFKKERPWGNRSCRSLQKSNREQIALDFFKKERRQWFACDSSESLSKTSDSLEKKLFFECFWQFSPFVCQKSESFPLLFAQPLFFKEGRDRFALVALYKRDTMSKLIPWIFKTERLERFALFHERIALLITKNERFARTTGDRIPNPECV